MEPLLGALWNYNIALCVNEKSVSEKGLDHLEWVAEKRKVVGKLLDKFVNLRFAQCSVEFLTAYNHWQTNREMYEGWLDSLERDEKKKRKDWLALERAVAVIFFHQGFLRYKTCAGARYCQLALRQATPSPWRYLRAPRATKC